MTGRSGSGSCLDWPRSDLWPFFGRNEGTKNNIKDANENCTRKCTAVVNMGNRKLSLSGENIHLLYCEATVSI